MQTIGNAFVFGLEVWNPPYHVELIRSALTRHIIPFFGTIYDEIETSFRDLVPVEDKGTSSRCLLVEPGADCAQNGFLSMPSTL